MVRLLKELAVPGVFGVFGATYIATTTSLPLESTVFPRTLFGVMLVIGILLLLKEATTPAPSDEHGALVGLRLPALIFAASVGYLVLFAAAGFLVASCVYLAGIMVALRVRIWKAVTVATAFSLSMYLIFGKLFLVDL